MAKITLATLSTATAQQVFDQVRDHLLRQGKRSNASAVPGDICAYRSHDGLQCAAGNLIADDEYKPEMERRAWRHLIDRELVPDTHRELIQNLQTVHDLSDPSRWEERLRAVAEDHGLAWTITLATLPTASAQEVFEQAAKHLLKQNAVARGARGCQYRTDKGLACAAGALLSDEDAATLTDSDNGESWYSLMGRGLVPTVHGLLIEQLQTVHDGYSPHLWLRELRRLARVRGLDDFFLTPATPCEPISIPETAQA